MHRPIKKIILLTLPLTLLSGWFLFPHQIMNDSDEMIKHSHSPKNFANHEPAKKFMNKMAKKYNFPKDDLMEILQIIKYDDEKKKIVKQVQKPPEKIPDWKSYQKQFLTPKRINAGKDFWITHRKFLNKISRHYQVPVYIIVSTLGVESFYGKHTGKLRVIDSLVTLSFIENRRNKFYLSELEQFFLLAKNNSWDIDKLMTINGSYSGAIGPAQFIPSSINYLSVDWNGDGKKNMVDDMEDVIASIGHYYRKSKWKPGKQVVKKLNKKPINADARKDILVVKGNQGQEYWKIHPNYKTIRRYNNSALYVLAIYNLGKEIYKQIN